MRVKTDASLIGAVRADTGARVRLLDTIDDFTRGYVDGALWSTTDNSDQYGGQPLDENYGIGDIAESTLRQMQFDCVEFQKGCEDELEVVRTICGDKRAGMLFWLNRNGHGSGFWDEYGGADPNLCRAFEALAKSASAFGEVCLYVGDDGKIDAG